MNLLSSSKKGDKAGGRLWRQLAVLCLAWALSSCTAIRPVPVVAFTDHRHAMLYAELTYNYPGDSKFSPRMITVPAGFVTDHASIPPSLKRYFESGGMAYQYPAIVHDWLYWEQSTSREEADRIFDAAMLDCGVGDLKRRAIYSGVRAGGRKAWDKNRKEKEMGLLKVIPEEHRDPSRWREKISWPEFRLRLSGPSDSP